MSFEKYINTLQKKSRREQKVFMLVTTSIVFLGIMAVLSQLGAFTLSSKTTTVENGDSFLELKEELSEAIVELNDGLDTLSSSTADMTKVLKDMASSTTSNATSTDEYAASLMETNSEIDIIIPLSAVPNEEETDKKSEVITEKE